MNNEDQFEQRLRRQPLRPMPSAWRAKILVAANANQRKLPVRELTLAAARRLRLRELFWPAPQAWAGLAGIWLVILLMNLAMREPQPKDLASQASLPSPQIRELLRQQEQLIAELVGPKEDREADRPKSSAPQPRSDRRQEFLTA